MTTDPTKSLAPQPLPPAEKNALTEMLDSDLAHLSLRELLGMLLSSVGLAERKAYLERVVHDKPNGFYARSLAVGAIPLDLRVPRTRTGDFRPATLPPLYQRGYSQETQSLLLSLLSSGRSLNAVKDALQKMGLSTSPQELDRVATGLIEELELRNSRSLDPDLLALFLDGKYVRVPRRRSSASRLHLRGRRLVPRWQKANPHLLAPRGPRKSRRLESCAAQL